MANIIKVIFQRKNTNVAGGNFSFKTTDENGKEYIIMTPTMMSEAYLGKFLQRKYLSLSRIQEGLLMVSVA